MSNLRLIGWSEVENRFCLTHWPIRARIADGLFVTPVSNGGQSVRFPEHEVDQIIAARIAGKTDDEVRALVVKLETERTGKPATPRRKPARKAANQAHSVVAA